MAELLTVVPLVTFTFAIWTYPIIDKMMLVRLILIRAILSGIISWTFLVMIYYFNRGITFMSVCVSFFSGILFTTQPFTDIEVNKAQREIRVNPQVNVPLLFVLEILLLLGCFIFIDESVTSPMDYGIVCIWFATVHAVILNIIQDDFWIHRDVKVTQIPFGVEV